MEPFHLVLPWILVFFAYNFLFCGLIINFLQLCSLVFLLFSKQLYRKINHRLAYMIWSHMTFAMQWWSGGEIRLYTDTKETKEDLENHLNFGQEHCLILLNHKYDIDWLVGYCLVERLGLLGGAKVFAKEQLKYIPIQGWAWIFTEGLFLKRNLEQDKDIITRSMSNLMTFPAGYWADVLLFAEGTRFTDEKHEASVKVALAKGMVPLKHHLLPRAKGFTIAMQATGDQLGAVYDCCVGFKKEGAQPTFLNVLLRQKCCAEFHVRRIPSSDIPKDDTRCAAWLQDAFVKKDNLFDGFINTGHFEGHVTRLPRRYNDLLSWCAQAALSLYALLKGLQYMVNNGGFGWTHILVLVLLAITVVALVRYMIAFSETHRGSDYGKAGSAVTRTSKTD